MLTILIVLVALAVCWIFALEVRFHSLKDIAGESHDLATDALKTARSLLKKKL
jgi:hypothetical protein